MKREVCIMFLFLAGSWFTFFVPNAAVNPPPFSQSGHSVSCTWVCCVEVVLARGYTAFVA